MKLILCSDADTTAAWAYTNLISLGCADLEIVTSGDLVHATQWSHRVTSDASTVEIRLQDGRHIDFASVDGVINRLDWPSRALIGMATREDQDYAWSESYAFYLSWLYALPGKVFNRTTPQGLCGSLRSSAEWAVLAGQAGFHVELFHEQETNWARPLPAGRTLTRVVAFQGKPFGLEDTQAIEPACQALFECCGTSLLGLDLYQLEDGRWSFHGATPLPDLRVGGLPLLRDILKVWSGEVMQ